MRLASTAYVLRRLETFGPVMSDNKGSYWRHHKGQSISFIDQRGEAICIQVRSLNDHDDLMSDYHAGMYVDNISQAIRLARW